jgi:hypothetical protein
MPGPLRIAKSEDAPVPWINGIQPGVVVPACNPSTWEAEAGGSPV